MLLKNITIFMTLQNCIFFVQSRLLFLQIKERLSFFNYVGNFLNCQAIDSFGVNPKLSSFAFTPTTYDTGVSIRMRIFGGKNNFARYTLHCVLIYRDCCYSCHEIVCKIKIISAIFSNYNDNYYIYNKWKISIYNKYKIT